MRDFRFFSDFFAARRKDTAHYTPEIEEIRQKQVCSVQCVFKPEREKIWKMKKIIGALDRGLLTYKLWGSAGGADPCRR